MTDAGTFTTNSDIELGQMLLYLDGKLFAFSTSCELVINTNMIDTSNQLDGSWESSVAGKKSFTVNCNTLVTDKANVMTADGAIAKQIAGSALTFKFGKAIITENADGSVSVTEPASGWTGKVNITSSTLTSEAGNLCKYQCQMQGAGALVPIS